MFSLFNRLIAAICIFSFYSFAVTYHVFPSQTALKKSALQKGVVATTSLLDITRQLQPDDTVYMRGGSHKYSTTVRLYKSGTAAKRIHVVGYPGDGTVELDFSGNDGVGMVIDASYVNYSGQTFRGARDNGLLIEGNNITISRCTFLENGDSGLQIEGANNTIINCDSYYNKDPGGENADGFAPKLDVGSGNKFIGCRAWQNSDDGWDGYLKSNKDVSQSLENCWAFKNGYLKDGSVSQGNGNGFKPGSDVGKQNWTFKNCLACGNLSKGFDQNHNLGSVTLYNCTAADNKKYDYVEYEQPASGKSATYKNCLQFSSSGVKGLNLGSFVQVTSCSWSGGIEVDASDFESTDLSELTAPRKSDGSLPDIKYLHIKEGSDLIDAGTDVGIAFKGKAPDLGAFESSYTTTVEQENTVSPPGIRVKLTADNTIMAIEYHLPKEGVVKLAVYTLSGKRLFETAPLHKTQGLGADYIDVGSITSGLYICSLILDGVGTTAQAVLR